MLDDLHFWVNPDMWKVVRDREDRDKMIAEELGAGASLSPDAMLGYRRENAFYDDYTVDAEGRYVPSLRSMGGRDLRDLPESNTGRRGRHPDQELEETSRIGQFIEQNRGKTSAMGAVANALQGLMDDYR